MPSTTRVADQQTLRLSALRIRLRSAQRSALRRAGDQSTCRTALPFSRLYSAAELIIDSMPLLLSDLGQATPWIFWPRLESTRRNSASRTAIGREAGAGSDTKKRRSTG